MAARNPQLQRTARLALREPGAGDLRLFLVSARGLPEIESIARNLADEVGRLSDSPARPEVKAAEAYLQTPPTDTRAEDLAVLVARAGGCRRTDLEQTRDALEEAGLRILGVLLVGGKDPLPRALRRWID